MNLTSRKRSLVLEGHKMYNFRIKSRMYKRYMRYKTRYSQTCIKRSHLGQRKSGLLKQVTSFSWGTLKCHISIGLFVVYIDTRSPVPNIPSKSRCLADGMEMIWNKRIAFLFRLSDTVKPAQAVTEIKSPWNRLEAEKHET
jgi:hypothetical protein